MTKDYLLPNKTYDWLKNINLVVLPGIGALYYALSGIWGLPKGDEVVATIAAVVTFIGLFIKVADKSYNSSSDKFDGELYVGPNMNRFVYHEPLEVLEQKSDISFKVLRTPPPEIIHEEKGVDGDLIE